MRWCSSPAKLASQRVRPDELYVMPRGRREVRCEDDMFPLSSQCKEGMIMKSIFDSSFKYRPSFKTDVRETFLRVRQELETQIRQEQEAQQEQKVGNNLPRVASY